jgi:hypothetical protein
MNLQKKRVHNLIYTQYSSSTTLSYKKTKKNEERKNCQFNWKAKKKIQFQWRQSVERNRVGQPYSFPWHLKVLWAISINFEYLFQWMSRKKKDITVNNIIQYWVRTRDKLEKINQDKIRDLWLLVLKMRWKKKKEKLYIFVCSIALMF